MTIKVLNDDFYDGIVTASWLVVPILDVVAQKSDRTRLNKDHLALLITTGLEALDLRASPVIYGHYHANKYDDEIVVHLLRTAALRQSVSVVHLVKEGIYF